VFTFVRQVELIDKGDDGQMLLWDITTAPKGIVHTPVGCFNTPEPISNFTWSKQDPSHSALLTTSRLYYLEM
jgi:hypothetical protein